MTPHVATSLRRALAHGALLVLALTALGGSALGASVGNAARSHDRASGSAQHERVKAQCRSRSARARSARRHHRASCARKAVHRTSPRRTRHVTPRTTPTKPATSQAAPVTTQPAGKAPASPAPVPPPAPSPALDPPAPLLPVIPTPPLPPVLPPVTPPTAGPLRWAPPELVNPITVQLGTGYTRTTLSPTRDYIVRLPDTVKTGGTWIIGGHNVVIVGGSIAIAADAAAGTSQRTGLYVKDATGTVHVEGVLIDAAGGAQVDGIGIAAPQATVQLENLRVVGLHGGFNSFHADVVQPWGGVGDLRIDHLTGSSDYQGLTLQQDVGPIGSAELSNVDLTATTPATLDGGGHMLWLTTGSSSCTTFPISFADVYAQPRQGRTMANSVWPQKNTPVACHETGATFGTWPDLPFSGGVTAGAPAGGSFVPAGAAGLGYVTPGYAG